MKHIVKVNNIQEAKDSDIRPIIAMDANRHLFFEGLKVVPEGFVDLGLPSGTLWSTKNIGATNGDTAESWYGNHYAWGEIKTKSDYYNWTNYKYAIYSYSKLTKYCNVSNYGDKGFTDQLTQLVPEDDVATQTNSEWRMPTKEDFDELLAGTTSRWETDYKGISGLNGRLFIKTKITRPAFKNIPLYLLIVEGESSGTTNELNDELWANLSMYTLEELNAIFGGDIREQIFKDAEMKIEAKYNTDYGFVEKEVDPTISMFIPAAGYCNGSDIYDVGSDCSLWSSSLDLANPNNAYCFSFYSDDIRINNTPRHNGYQICPVC